MIADATTSSLKVTDAMVGKYIKVVATGDEGSSQSATTTAPVVAEESAKIAIASAKQVGASKIEVVFNKAVSTSEWDITVSRGSTVQANPTIVLDDAATTATITLGTAMSTAEYTVKIAKKADATENAESKFNAEQATLKSIDFVGEQLILTSSDMKNAAVSISGKNQFDEDVALSGALTVYSTKGKAEYKQSEKKIVITCGESIFFTTGEQVTVTAVYNSGNIPLQVSKALTVSNVATLTKFELGDVATTSKALKDKRLDLKALGSDTYYFPVKVAEDQYGNKLSAKELDTMMVKGAANASKNLYITPYQADGSYAYVTGFTALEDGTIAMNISKGSLGTPGTAVFSITGVSGYSGTKELKIEDDPYVAELNVSAPSLFKGQEAELTVTAKDQYGAEINLYDVDVDDRAANLDAQKYVFKDKNNLTKGNSSISFSDKNATLKIKRNTSKKTISFLYTPGTDGQTIVTVQSATPTVSNLTWTVDGEPSIAGIQGVNRTITTQMTGDQGSQDLGDNESIVWLDSSGAVAADANKFPTYKKTGDGADSIAEATPGAQGASKFYYTVAVTQGKSVAVNNGTGALTVARDAQDRAITGSSQVTITLYEVKTVNQETKRTAIAEKIVKFTVQGNPETYKASIAKGDELLYVNKNSFDTVAFSVTGIDANGYEADFGAYTVTVDSNLPLTDNKKAVGGWVDGVSAKGTAVATIWVDGKSVATVDVPYDVAKPAPQKAVQFVNYESTTATDFEDVANIKQNLNGTVTFTTDGDPVALYIVDQYGCNMLDTSWSLGGKGIATGDGSDLDSAVLTATNGKVSGSWTVTGDNVACSVEEALEASITVTAFDAGEEGLHGRITAVEDGTVYVLSAAQYEKYMSNQNLPWNDAAAKTANAGDFTARVAVHKGNTAWAATVGDALMTGGAMYYAVYVGDYSGYLARASKAAEAAVMTSISGATVTGDSGSITTGTEATVSAVDLSGAKDQYGNAWTFMATGDNDLEGVVTTKNTGAKPTATLDVVTAGTLKITVTGADNGAELQTSSPADKIVFTDDANGLTYTFVLTHAATSHGNTAGGQVDGTVWTCTATITDAA